MSKGLAYFRQVYDTVPDWVQNMHDYNPVMLDTYTEIRGEAFRDAVLSRAEKDVLIASMNAARLYARSMVYHTKGAVDHGLTIAELAEYFLVAYLYNGVDSLKTSLEALAYALQLQGIVVQQPVEEPATVEDVIAVMIKWVGGDDAGFLKESLEVIKTGNNLAIEEQILAAGKVPARLKYLNMVGNYIVELRGKDAVPWIERARQNGVTEAELADLGFICILTAGIPTWFELSDSLKSIK